MVPEEMLLPMRSTLMIAGILFAHAAAAAPLYRLAATAPLGDPPRWDYLTYEPARQRLFVAHLKEVTVLDTRTLQLAGKVTGIDGAHGVALVPGGHGYAASGETGTVVAFDQATLLPVATIAAQKDADGMAYDPASRNVYVINGGNGSITVIDPKSDQAVATIHTGGDLEFAAADGKGHLFVNRADTGAVLRIDTTTNAVTATWTMPHCTRPHGLAVDPTAQRVFSSCANGIITVLDARTGKILAEPTIGHGSDAVVYDAARQRVFSSNGDGTVSVIDAQTLQPLAPLMTERGARTMAVDPASGRLFLVTAALAEKQPPGARRPSFAPGTLHALIFDPAS
jgi:YVTN family beta-propeller protein